MLPNIYDLNLGFKSTIQITIQIMDHSVNESAKVQYFKFLGAMKRGRGKCSAFHQPQMFPFFNVHYLEPKNSNASLSEYSNHLNAEHLNTGLI